MFDGFFVKGVILGFSIAAPVGPIGILCIQRSLNSGFVRGFASGLGAATADALYGVIAAFGLSVITSFLVARTGFLRLGGGLFLCYLGVKTFLSVPSDHAVSLKSEGLIGSYLSTFLLTLTNPMTILSFTLIFGGVGLSATAGDYTSATLVVLGVFTGSGSWWLLLSTGVSFFRKRFSLHNLRWVNRISGGIIAGLGLLVLLNGFG
jgi:threonine/homoserine/homoserine lactone efflux protein